jgi:DNA-binding transcriptional LysR family regulator
MTTLQTLAWDDFRLVKTIAEAKGLAGAAERLGVNHSTVFRRLGQLEEDLGVKLFERHRTGYALTAAGEEMALLAERMEEDVATFARKLAGQAVSPAGELRVTTNDTLLVHLLTPLFARFAKACPDVRLDVVLANQALNLSKRDADVAIRATDNPPETLVGRRVATIAWAIYGRAADFPSPAPSISWISTTAPGWRSATTWRAEGGALRARARGRRAHRLQGQHGARARGGRGGGNRHRPPALLHRRRAPEARAALRRRTRISRPACGSSPTRTCASRPGCGPSWISWRPRSPSSAGTSRDRWRSGQEGG